MLSDSGVRQLIPGVWWQPARCKEGFRTREAVLATWRLLPLSVRRRLRADWRSPHLPLLVAPEVRVADDWPGRAPGVFGEARSAGHLLWLRAAAVRHFPDRPLIGLVAHELAHSYGYAERLDGHRTGDPDWLAERTVADLLGFWDLLEYQDDQEVWLRDHPDVADELRR